MTDAAAHSRVDVPAVRTIRLDARGLACLIRDHVWTPDQQGGSAQPRVGIALITRDESEATPYQVIVLASPNGDVAFLHGGFVHPGTRCALLWEKDARHFRVVGTVHRCRYLDHNVHIVQLDPDHPLETTSSAD